MSTTEESRALFQKWWAAFIKGDLEGMHALYADDFRGWSPGRGYIGKEETKQFSNWFRTLLVDGWFKFDEPLVTVQDDRVCFATASHADLKNGNHYNNHYHFLLFIKDGKIVETREYNDTGHVMAVLHDEIMAKRAEMAGVAA